MTPHRRARRIWASGPGASCPRVPFGYAFTEYRPDLGRGPGAGLCISPRGGRHPVRTSLFARVPAYRSPPPSGGRSGVRTSTCRRAGAGLA
jgi:hypothetical protein